MWRHPIISHPRSEGQASRLAPTVSIAEDQPEPDERVALQRPRRSYPYCFVIRMLHSISLWLSFTRHSPLLQATSCRAVTGGAAQ